MDITPLLQPGGKILLVVADGLGGMADAVHDTELEQADTPHLDRLAAEGVTGLATPVLPGITPGSGPGHLALFGYDPLQHELGRGVLSATGVEFDLRPGDVAARGNLATFDDDGNVADRRAGRIDDAKAEPLVARLDEGVRIDGVEVFFRHEASHRVLLVVRGEGLDPRVSDTDPEIEGRPPKAPEALDPAARHTAEVVAEVERQVRELLAGEPAHGLLLRGFDTLQHLPSFTDRYGLHAATVAIYPMYRGVAHLVGMDLLPRPDDLDGQVAAMADHWDDYDYFFLHHKYTDEAGHDGDRPRKVAEIERLDAAMPAIRDLAPDVLVVTGDHATPTQLHAHSWHPVPVLMWGPHVGRDHVDRFGERACLQGGLGQRPTREFMPLALAAAGRLRKYGA
ncbi:2,3-bisphosphoglycerate-independent phosphoglycerate mutase [Egibacter rhizosphaerae]|uniref:2,3-bisphosphoglycerate-independent phosphoglycerate mutase n=1 Tax=Egibacter rhizosphaerae TaxID=1670831 RepID=UPI00197A711B|nr:2,3-bisphosphoglycerate-independent phosphoglycerate mutase [Egibacter rhizosphaerae]